MDRRSWYELSKLENADKRPEGRHNMNNGMVNKQKYIDFLIKGIYSICSDSVQFLPLL